jgi:hypothetical protein
MWSMWRCRVGGLWTVVLCVRYHMSALASALQIFIQAPLSSTHDHVILKLIP